MMSEYQEKSTKVPSTKEVSRNRTHAGTSMGLGRTQGPPLEVSISLLTTRKCQQNSINNQEGKREFI